MNPLLLIGIGLGLFYLYKEKPEILSQFTGGANWDKDGVTSGNTPFAQGLISTRIAPLGSKLNPRLMTYTDYVITLPAGSTDSDAQDVARNRGSNIALKDFQYSNGIVYLTVITNDAPELAGFDANLRSRYANVQKTGQRTVKYYLIANSWIAESEVQAFIADCARQKTLNPNVGMGDCPTSW
jgi:hypothetical protein